MNYLVLEGKEEKVCNYYHKPDHGISECWKRKAIKEEKKQVGLVTTCTSQKEEAYVSLSFLHLHCAWSFKVWHMLISKWV